MGNAESSSQLPNEFNKKEKEQETHESSATGTALKIGAAVAGSALLALGALSLTSSSSSHHKDDSRQKLSVPEGSGPWKNENYRGGSFSMFKKEKDPNLIKIMSYNVWFREDVEVVERMEAIGRLILQHHPDVIFFQEVTPLIYSIFEDSRWWSFYECSVPPERATRRYFCMLLSKLPVKRFLNYPFEDSTMGREVCMAVLDAGTESSLVVANTHLESPNPPEMNSNKRVAHAKEALSQLNRLPNVVFGGDMNWDEENDGPFPLQGSWVDAWAELREEEDGWTYDTKANQSLRGYRPLQKRLDRFVCKLRDFNLVDMELIGREPIPGISYCHRNKENPIYPSDHFGLLLTISPD